MKTSQEVADIGMALGRVQAMLHPITADARNALYDSPYATIGAVWRQVRKALKKCDLAVVQGPGLSTKTDNVWTVEVETMLIHGSGQWIASTVSVPLVQCDAMGVAACVTIARRIGLVSMLGLTQDDDDGVSQRKESARKRAASKHVNGKEVEPILAAEPAF